jgi:hypothetical protein
VAKHRLSDGTPKQWNDSQPPTEAFHGLAGRVVLAIEPHTEASAGALLLQFLTAFGFSVGRGPHYVADGAHHYPNLFCVVVGDTAKSRKGTSWGRIHALFKQTFKWPTERVKNGLSSGEGLITALCDREDRRLLVVQTEFASVLKVMSRAGNTLSPVLRDAWDGSDLNILTRKSPVSVSGEHVALIGHVTCGELNALMAEIDLWNGFANRFLWCSASRSKLLPHGGEPSGAIIKPLVAELTDVLKWACRLGGKCITWEKAAAEEWDRIYRHLADETSGLIGAITSRGEAQIVRLALIYALLDKSLEIRTEHLLAAFAVWQFCEASARQVFGSSTGDSTADRIRDALRESDGGMSRTEINALFKRHRSSDEISRALATLKDLELAESRNEKGAGRSTERWFAKAEQE